MYHIAKAVRIWEMKTCWVRGGFCEADSIVMEECKFTGSHKRFYTAAVNSEKKKKVSLKRNKEIKCI